FAGRPVVLNRLDLVEGAGFGLSDPQQEAVMRPRQVLVQEPRLPRLVARRATNSRRQELPVGQEELPTELQVCGAVARSEAFLESGRQLTDPLFSVLRPGRAPLFFLSDLAPDQPVRHDLCAVDGSGHSRLGRSGNRAESLVNGSRWRGRFILACHECSSSNGGPCFEQRRGLAPFAAFWLGRPS